MKQIKIGFYAILLLTGLALTKTSTAQKGPTCDSAKVLTYPINNTVTSYTADAYWFKVTLDEGYYSIKLTNHPGVGKITKAEVYLGTCPSLTLTSTDTLASPTDTTFNIKIHNTVNSTSFYVKLYNRGGSITFDKTVFTDIKIVGQIGFCPGQQVTLTAFPIDPIGTQTYTWLPGSIDNHANSYTITPSSTVTPTTYTLIYNDDGGILTTTVNIFPLGPDQCKNCEMVQNGHFEWYDGYTNSMSNFVDAGIWTNPTRGTPDIFNANFMYGDVSVPVNNETTNTPAHSGQGYAGFLTYTANSFNYREYIQNPLICPLVADQQYQVSFFVISSDIEQKVSNNIGAYLSTNTISSGTNLPLNFTPQINQTGVVNYTNPTTWTQISGIITGNNEDHITIGNFYGHPPITTTLSSTSSNTISVSSASYYFIDDVSITPLTPTLSSSTNTVSCNCASTITLTATGASSLYTSWTDGTTTYSGSVVSIPCPTVTTTYTATVDLPCSTCTPLTETITVSVISSQTITATASPTSICSGSSTTLTASGSSTYTWMPGGLTGASVSVSPTVTTTYTVTGRNGNCVNTQTVTVNVTTTPTVSIVGTPTNVCAGSSSTLTASGATTYSWNTGAITASIVVTPTASATTYTVTGKNGTCSHVKTITIIRTSPLVPTATASPTTVCAGSSTTLTASSATTYTWLPGGTNTKTVVVNPTATTIYTLAVANSACTSTTTVLVNINPVPSITLSPSSGTGICLGQSVTVTASGANTYTWNTGVTTASIALSPTVTTNYTVTGTGTNGCTSKLIYNLPVNAIPTISVTASSNSICAGNTTTLTMTAGGNINVWTPPGTFSNTVVVSPNVTTTYTATTTVFLTGCTNSTVITVTVNPFTSLTVNPSTICVGQTATLTASGATSYTWSTGASTPSITVSPTVTTNYTVSGVGSSCNSSVVLTVVVNNNPTITATASPTNVCVGNASTLTASGATSYSWSSGGTTAATTVTPGAVSIYTVTGTTNGCSATNTVQIALTPQYCCQSASFTIGTSTTSATSYSNTSNGNGAVIDMQGTITFSANSTMSNYIIRMAPSSKIVIYAGVTLTFSNCTIYSCTELWQGIVIQENAGDAGNLNVINSSIEDMYLGISMVGPYYTYPSSSTNGNVTITNSKLNKNYASIYMNTFPKYDDNGLFQYGLSVTGSTISCLYSPTSPQSTLKSSSTYTYAYNTVDNVTVPYTYFPRSYAGIVLNNLSDSPVIVGDKTGTNGSNRFENLDFGIVAIDAHLKAYNNHFINIKGSTKYITTSAGPDEIGIGIYAAKTNTANRMYPITIGEGTTTPNGSNALPAGNRFEDCAKGVRVDDYDGEVALKGNEFISNANTVVDPLALPPGYLYFYNTAQNGIWIKNVQIKAIVTNNYIKNHTYGIYSSHNILSTHISTAFVKIEDNLIEAPSSTGFCTQAIEVSQPASTNNLLTGKLTVKNNTIQNVYRGIKGSNVKGGLQINDNPVIDLSAAKMYGIIGTTSQKNNFDRIGIRLDNCVDPVVANNPNITSNGTINSTYYIAVKGILLVASGGTNGQVNCNTISNMGRCMQFNNTSLNKVAKNVMNGTYQGFVLSNSGIIGPQGVSGTMTNDNEWHGFTGGAAQYAETYTQLTSNANVFPSGSVLFVKPGSPYQPTQNYSSNGNPYVTGSGDGIRSQSLSTPGESCLSLRLMGENNNAGMAMRTATDEDSTAAQLYEVLASDTTYYEVYQDETQYLNKQLVYELLNTQSIEATQNLQDFYTANQSGTYHDFVSINASIGTENYTTAQSINDGITATNVIESYQKRLNELLLKYLSYQSQSVLTNSLSVPLFNTIAVFDDNELNDLTAIANSCLDKYGNVVTQARVLLNNVSNTLKEYENNCNPEYSQRKGKTNKATVISNGITANVLPNPNNGNFILQYDLAKYPSADLVIYDVTGKLMLEESLTNTEKQINMNVDKFENGIYYYTIRTNKEILVTNKFVIIK